MALIKNVINDMGNNKIALLSYLNSYNYGTILQDYALHKIIMDLGYENEYFNYVNYVPSKGIRKFLGKIKRVIIKPKSSGKGIDDFSYWRSCEFNKTLSRFDKFIEEEIHIGKQYNPLTLGEAESHYDKFIVGSDQTWSPNIINEKSIYLLNFVSSSEKKASYAPSMGTINIPTAFIDLLKAKLSSFKYLSCRERSNCEMLSSALKREVKYVLDPTLLLTPEEWSKVSKLEEGMPEKYILCYVLGEKQCISDYAEEMGEKLSLPVYYIVTRKFYENRRHSIRDAGPREFVSLIANATYLVTDSFHGSIFAVNHCRPFYVFTKREGGDISNDNGRIKEMLTEFGLMNRFCKDSSHFNYNEEIDYSEIIRKVEALRAQSMDYLQKILKRES